MNSRERVFATTQGQPVDRRPFTAMLSLYGAKLTGCPLERYYRDGHSYAEGQQAVRETFRPDILFSPMVCVAEGEAFGSEVRILKGYAPNLASPAIDVPARIDTCSIPDVDSHPSLVYVRQALRRMVDDHGDETLIAAILMSPVDLPLMILGLDRWLETLLFDADGVRRVLDVTVPFFHRWAAALLADGAHVLALPAAMFNPAVTTRTIAEEIAFPALEQAFAAVGAPIVIHHAGGTFLEYIDLYARLPNVAGIVVNHGDDFSEVRHRGGAGFTLFGGMDGPQLARSTPDEVVRRASLILEDRRDDARYVLSTSNADVSWDTPEETIHALREAVESWG
jgi:uroporphyrinogen decarboxylase